MSNSSKPLASKIMVIRHAEKPFTDKHGTNYLGIKATGKQDGESLIVRGWQRAGALVVFFNPFSGPLQNKQLSIPIVLYAAHPGSESYSERPLETITPLSQHLQIPINQQYGKADYKPMVDNAMAQSGTVLISWQHQHIPAIANHILGPDHKNVPQTWPDHRFDVVWVFTLDATTGKYVFSQVPQNLLAGDENKPIT